VLKPSVNRPYTAFGTHYEPLPPDRLYEATGWASWYGVAHQGQPTASGETFDMNAFTAAHPLLPVPSYAQITNLANGAQAIVRVNDRGPFREKRVMDVSLAAARHLGFANQGLGKVSVRLLSSEQASSWLHAGAVQPASAVHPATTSAAKLASAPAVPVTTNDNPKQVSSDVAKGFYAQLGAYKDAASALVLAQRADQAARDLQLTTSLRPNEPLVQLVNGDSATGRLARVLAGPFATRAEADKIVASFSDALGIKPFVIQQK
jgi:rare lipoprotein A